MRYPRISLITAYRPSRIALGPVDVAAVRIRLKMRQREFALRFAIPLTTLRHWEQEDRRPTGPALVLMHLIQDNPQAVLAAMQRIRFRRR